MARTILFLYLGRRGAMARFVVDLAAAVAAAGQRALFVVSEDVEAGDALHATGADVRFAPVFASAPGAFALWRVLKLQRLLKSAIKDSETDTVVELMPHLWSPFLEAPIRQAGARRIAVLHDWQAHPGDATALATRWLAASTLRADRVVTLSRHVADVIATARPAAAGKLLPLFHPDFGYVAADAPQGPLRVLFLGRLAAYKGLGVFVDAVEQARANGAALEISVCGAGEIEVLAERLSALGARVVNHWLSDAEIAQALAWAHVIAVTHTEASQSGIVAAAFGAGRPVVATPVGALAEQVSHERTGLVADRADASAVSHALRRLAEEPALLARLTAGVRVSAEERSMQRFLEALQNA